MHGVAELRVCLSGWQECLRVQRLRLVRGLRASWAQELRSSAGASAESPAVSLRATSRDWDWWRLPEPQHSVRVMQWLARRREYWPVVAQGTASLLLAQEWVRVRQPLRVAQELVWQRPQELAQVVAETGGPAGRLWVVEEWHRLRGL